MTASGHQVDRRAERGHDGRHVVRTGTDGRRNVAVGVSELRRRPDSTDDTPAQAESDRRAASAGSDAGARRAAPPRPDQSRRNDRPSAPRAPEQANEPEPSAPGRKDSRSERSGSDRPGVESGPEDVDEAERARRKKYNIPENAADRALTPEQEAAIARLTGNAPSGSSRFTGRSRMASPSDRARPQAAPEAGSGHERTEISGLRARHASDLSEATGRGRPRDDRQFDHPDSVDTGRGDERAGLDGPDRVTDLDTAKAQIADLKRQLADRDAKLDAASSRIDQQAIELEVAKTRLDEQAAEIAQQREMIGKQSRGLEAASNKISALENRTADQDTILGNVLERMQRLENRGADEPDRGVDQHEIPQLDHPDARLDHPEQAIDELPAQGRADEPAVGEQGWAERADGPRARRTAPSNEALGFMVSGATTVFTGVSDILPPAEAGLGLAGGLLGMGVAGIAWLRQRRKAKNADRPEG